MIELDSFLIESSYVLTVFYKTHCLLFYQDIFFRTDVSKTGTLLLNELRNAVMATGNNQPNFVCVLFCNLGCCGIVFQLEDYGLDPSPCIQHVDVFLGKILNPKVLRNGTDLSTFLLLCIHWALVLSLH